MKTVGIICECNPLHAGHLYLVERARSSGADAVIAVMSGCFVQRGEAAVADPYARAEILVRSGFDAVLELPYPFSAASAEFFGGAGVEILSRLGVEELWFGSECGDIEALMRCAAIAESDAFRTALSKGVQSAGGTAKVYFECLRAFCNDEHITFDPNDILALSYLRAICKRGTSIRPVTVKRMGSSYGETELTDGMFPSATALRRAWQEEGLDSICHLLPASCAEVLRRESDCGGAPANLAHAEALVLGMLRLASPERLERIAELDGGLGNRMARLSHKAASLEELMCLCATKKYPDARLRRGLLFALTDVTPEDLRREIAYVRLLAANKTGCAFLAEVRKATDLTVLTRNADIPASENARMQWEMETRERALYTLCMPQKMSDEPLLRRTPLIL